MGAVCCDNNKGTSFERKVTQDIDNHLQSDIAKIPRTHRILLIGPGESGKSTLIKQMIKIHRGNIANDTLNWSSSKIKTEVVQMMKVLCRATIDLKIELDEDIVRIRNRMSDIEVKPDITPDIVDEMKLLWSNRGIKEALDQRHKFQIANHCSYWFDSRLDDIFLSDSYHPTFGDYLRLRLRSSGCIEETFTTFIASDPLTPITKLSRIDSASMGSSAELVIDNKKQKEHTLTFVDVGGQRCERKKWFNMMKDNIHCVVYVIAISEYDLMCFEDDKTRRMTEALSLFETVLEKGFMDGKKKTVTLFFNKYDLLIKKLNDDNKESFRNYYNDFPHDKNDRNPTDICDFIFNKFKTIYKKWKKNGNIHYHCTTAMDTNQIENVFNDIVLDTIQCRMGTFVPL